MNLRDALKRLEATIPLRPTGLRDALMALTSAAVPPEPTMGDDALLACDTALLEVQAGLVCLVSVECASVVAAAPAAERPALDAMLNAAVGLLRAQQQSLLARRNDELARHRNPLARFLANADLRVLEQIREAQRLDHAYSEAADGDERKVWRAANGNREPGESFGLGASHG